MYSEKQKARRRLLYARKKSKDPMFMDKIRMKRKIWRDANPEKVALYQKKWKEETVGIDKFRENENLKRKEWRKNPWFRTYEGIYGRLKKAKKEDCLSKYWCYRGIEMHMTPNDLKMLWFRDKADQMKHPTIDRIDSKGHYVVDNCRYVELKDNLKSRKREYIGKFPFKNVPRVT